MRRDLGCDPGPKRHENASFSSLVVSAAHAWLIGNRPQVANLPYNGRARLRYHLADRIDDGIGTVELNRMPAVGDHDLFPTPRQARQLALNPDPVVLERACAARVDGIIRPPR